MNKIYHPSDQKGHSSFRSPATAQSAGRLVRAGRKNSGGASGVGEIPKVARHGSEGYPVCRSGADQAVRCADPTKRRTNLRRSDSCIYGIGTDQGAIASGGKPSPLLLDPVGPRVAPG